MIPLEGGRLKSFSSESSAPFARRMPGGWGGEIFFCFVFFNGRYGKRRDDKDMIW